MKKPKPCNFYKLPHLEEYMLYKYFGGSQDYHELYPLDPPIKPPDIIETPPITFDKQGNIIPWVNNKL